MGDILPKYRVFTEVWKTSRARRVRADAARRNWARSGAEPKGIWPLGPERRARAVSARLRHRKVMYDFGGPAEGIKYLAPPKAGAEEASDRY